MQIEPGGKRAPETNRFPGRCVFKKRMGIAQIMLACQQSGTVRPIMLTMVGATFERP